jgi:regulator of cell morphogenesis and NO signaling
MSNKITKDMIIWEIASKYPITVSVFLKHGAEFCCKGNVSIEEAATRDDFNISEIISDLNQLLETTSQDDEKVSEMESLVEITEYIKNNFHNPIRELLYPTEVLAKKVASVHWHLHPELVQISEIVEWMVPVIEIHFDKENQILHPMMAEIDTHNKAGTRLEWLHCGSIENPIAQMEFEHENYGDMLQELRKLTSDYTLPEWACRSYTALYANLEKLEEDLMRHTNLENFILHPKTIAMEKKVSGWDSCNTWWCGSDNEFNF